MDDDDKDDEDGGDDNAHHLVFAHHEGHGTIADGFADLLERLNDLGNRLDSTKRQYDQTMIKLRGKGNLLKKVENLKNITSFTSVKIRFP